jgi:ketosteroid isomerase-like protein
MSEGNVEAVRRVYEQWGRGNFRAGVELYDPHVVLVQRQELLESGTYLGLDGIRDYMAAFLEAWERVTIEAEEVFAAGDSVVAQVVQRAIGKESGVEPTEFEYFQIWSFRGGKVIRLEVIRDRDEALKAVGLSE